MATVTIPSSANNIIVDGRKLKDILQEKMAFYAKLSNAIESTKGEKFFDEQIKQMMLDVVEAAGAEAVMSVLNATMKSLATLNNMHTNNSKDTDGPIVIDLDQDIVHHCIDLDKYPDHKVKANWMDVKGNVHIDSSKVTAKEIAKIAKERKNDKSKAKTPNNKKVVKSAKSVTTKYSTSDKKPKHKDLLNRRK